MNLNTFCSLGVPLRRVRGDVDSVRIGGHEFVKYDKKYLDGRAREDSRDLKIKNS